MRRGEAEARLKLIAAVGAVIVSWGKGPVGVDNSPLDADMLEAAKDYVNAVVGPNMSGDRC